MKTGLILTIAFLMTVLTVSSKSMANPWDSTLLSGNINKGNLKMVVKNTFSKLEKKDPLNYSHFSELKFEFLKCENMIIRSYNYNNKSVAQILTELSLKNHFSFIIKENTIIFSALENNDSSHAFFLRKNAYLPNKDNFDLFKIIKEKGNTLNLENVKIIYPAGRLILVEAKHSEILKIKGMLDLMKFLNMGKRVSTPEQNK